MKVVAPSADAPLRAARVAVLDWETTWTDVGEQHPVSVAVVHCNLGVAGSEILAMEQLIKPPVPIRPEATKIHGVDDAKVADAPSLQQVLPGLCEFVSGRTLAAYNLPFDWKILADAIVAAGGIAPEFGHLDPLVWAKVADRRERGKKLGDVARRRGISFQAHDASADAMATARVMPLLLRDLKQMGVSTHVFDSIGAIWSWTKAEGEKWEKWYRGYCLQSGRPAPNLSYHDILGLNGPEQMGLPGC